jgi:hypothetical protein
VERTGGQDRSGELVEAALVGGLVGAQADEAGAVAQTAAGDMVERDLDDEAGPDRGSLRRALARPAAGPSWLVAGEARS